MPLAPDGVGVGEEVKKGGAARTPLTGLSPLGVTPSQIPTFPQIPSGDPGPGFPIPGKPPRPPAVSAEQVSFLRDRLGATREPAPCRPHAGAAGTAGPQRPGCKALLSSGFPF